MYKVTNRTIYAWIRNDKIPEYDGLYDVDDLQAAYDKRAKPEPSFRQRYVKWLKSQQIWHFQQTALFS